MLRRQFLAGLASALTFASLLPRISNGAQKTGFAHGVASGDPSQNAVILWTRVSGVSKSTRVRWSVARDKDMQKVVRRGRTKATADTDFTIKVDAGRLPAGSTLYYQFEANGVKSPVGRTKTLARGDLSTASLAVVSCSNHPYGYFHVYREIAKRDDLDAVLHLGDYIYEYAMGEYATQYAESLDRVPQPEQELRTLSDYRQRYQQYRSDPDLQAMHAQQAFIPVWDDHELANDAWKNGAENHQEGEGDWSSRRDIAIQAWLEWMPVRVRHQGARTRIYRQFRFGNLLSLLMLDTRMVGRDLQPDAKPGVSREDIIAAMRDPSRRLLGDKQEAWLGEALENSSNATWQALGQQVMVMPNLSPELEPILDLDKPAILDRETLQGFIEATRGNPPMLLDTWNGYPAARQDLLMQLKEKAKNAVVLSGDLHTAMAGSLVPQGESETVAVELMTSAVTSPGFTEYLPEIRPGAFNEATKAVNPHLSYMDSAQKGWLCVTFSKTDCVAEWHAIEGIRNKEYSSRIDHRLSVKAGQIKAGLLEA